MENTTNLKGLAVEKIEFGENLIKSLLEFGDIEGIQKLVRKIKQELTFLKKVSEI